MTFAHGQKGEPMSLTKAQIICPYCHEDADGYVKPLEKNCHAYVNRGFMGWHIVLKARGWMGEAKINFCPMCGRELNR